MGVSYAARADKARAELGWEPRVSLEEGLRQTFAWIDAKVRSRPVLTLQQKRIGALLLMAALGLVLGGDADLGGDLVHVLDRHAHLAPARGLLLRGVRDLRHDPVDVLLAAAAVGLARRRQVFERLRQQPLPRAPARHGHRRGVAVDETLGLGI